MKRFAAIAFATIALVAFSTPARSAGEVNFLLGQKALEDEDIWRPLEDHGEFGAQISLAGQDWPVHIAIDVLGSADEQEVPFAGKIEARTSELDVGARKIWRKGKAHPFLGGGIAFVNGEVKAFGASIDDDGTGVWIDGGAFWKLTDRFNLGVEARISRAEITLLGVDRDAGGNHLALTLGFGWPKP